MTPPPAPSGIRFALEGVDEITFHKVLRDLMKDPAFAKPLQVQAQPPRPVSASAVSSRAVSGDPADAATLTLVFAPEHRQLAVGAMQRLKTIMLRYGVQIDSIYQ